MSAHEIRLTALDIVRRQGSGALDFAVSAYRNMRDWHGHGNAIHWLKVAMAVAEIADVHRDTVLPHMA